MTAALLSSTVLAAPAKRAFLPSDKQLRFFEWVAKGRGNAILKAVAGSGKSTSIVRALPFVPPTAQVLILAFNAPIAKEMKTKIAELGRELGRDFANVEAATFHSRGYRALLRKWGRDVKVQIDDGKVRKILKDRLSEVEYETYGDFVAKLVGFAKGVGVGIPGIAPNEDATWANIIATQDMWLSDEEASEERAIEIAQKALAASNFKAEKERWIDFDDQLYLPLLWNLRLFRHDWVFVDEAQDTNPVRREFVRRIVKPAPFGRAVFVGDPCQSIYAFTGASSDAMDQIAEQFGTVELPLTVSYRCPRAVGELARTLVPYFEVAPGAIEGAVTYEPTAKAAIARLESTDVVLCRKTAPLIDLAFSLIAEGRGCRVLGKDVGAGLTSLVKKMRARGVENLFEKLARYYAREFAKLARAGNEAKAEGLADRIEAIRVVAENLPETARTVPTLIEKVEGLFGDGEAAVLTLSTLHKSKGREYPRVLLYGPELLPSKAAKTPEALQQEANLLYVGYTRATTELLLAPAPERRKA